VAVPYVVATQSTHQKAGKKEEAFGSRDKQSSTASKWLEQRGEATQVIYHDHEQEIASQDVDR
jgi:hypothetical protein